MTGRGRAPMLAPARVVSRTARLTLAGLREEARRRGFTHILTAGGPCPLDRWRPWGGPEVSYGVIPLDVPRFVILGEGMVQDTQRTEETGVRAALWPLMRPEAGA